MPDATLDRRTLTTVGSAIVVLLAISTTATVEAQTAADYRPVRVIDTVVNNTDATLNASDTFVDWEESIGINPTDPNEIVLLAFSGTQAAPPNAAALWHSTDSGQTWSKLFTLPQPPGQGFVPNDQTLDWGQNGNLFVTFLDGSGNIISGGTTNPANLGSFAYNVTAGVTQLTNNGAPGSIGGADQPWILANPNPTNLVQDNIYVAYDDFNNTDGVDGPDMRVAVSTEALPLNFTLDRQVGNSTAGINPGLRMAEDPATGAMYALWGRCVANCGGDPKTINYMLNRSVDGGNTWQLDGNAFGSIIATAQSTQPQPKFGGVNALLGGAHHAAVDPATGDVYYVYGNQDALGNDRFSIVRVQIDALGNTTIGAPNFVTGVVEAAVPQVAVDTNGVIAVAYYTFDGIDGAGFPTFSYLVGISDDQGANFTNLNLVSFQSPVTNDGNPRQRILGDYEQMRALGDCFYGGFAANGAPFGRPFNDIDPIYFQICAGIDETLSQIVGTATALPFPAGNLEITGVAGVSSTVDLGAATATVEGLLTEAGTELVSGLPVTMTAAPGSSATAATYVSVGNPTITLVVVELPLVGRVTQIVAAPAAITRPSSCGFLFGTASLETSFTLDDSTNPAVTIRGTDTWACFGPQLINL